MGRKAYVVVAASLVLLALVVYAAQVLRGAGFLTAHCMVDDGFYFARWAWNLAHGAGPTFDGRHWTNGVQPLWAAMLVPLAWISPSRGVFLQLDMACAAVMNVAAGLLLVRFAAKHFAPAASIAVAAMCLVMLANRVFAFGGLETSTSLLSFAAYLNWLGDWPRGAGVEGGELLRRARIGGVLLMLLGASRPDMLVYALVALMWVVPDALAASWSPVKLGAALFAPLCVAGGLYVCANQAAFHSAMPISGRVKLAAQLGEAADQHFRITGQPRQYHGRLDPKYLREFVAPSLVDRWVRIVKLPTRPMGASNGIGVRIAGALHRAGRRNVIGWLLLPLLGAPLGLALRRVRPLPEVGDRRPLRRWLLAGALVWLLGGLLGIVLGKPPLTTLLMLLAAGAGGLAALGGGWQPAASPAGSADELAHPIDRLLLALWLAAFLHVVIIVYGMGYWTYGYLWYFVPEAILVALTGGRVLGEAARIVLRGPAEPVAPYVLGLLALLWAAPAWQPTIAAVSSPGMPSSINASRKQLAAWLNHNLPRGTVVGAWNAGTLGYWYDGSLVNLDGLMNDRRFFDEVLSGQVTMEEYLRREGISYVADYDQAPGYRSKETPGTWYELPTDHLVTVAVWPWEWRGGASFRLFRLKSAAEIAQP